MNFAHSMVADRGRFLDRFVAALAGAGNIVARQVSYHDKFSQAKKELSSYSNDELFDMGINPADIDKIAHKAASESLSKSA